MDRVKIGNTFRTIRVELRLRQSDVAERAGLSQQTVSDLECGRFGRLSIDAYCRIAETIGADVPLTPRWRGPRLDRLLDRRHALLQNRAVELLASLRSAPNSRSTTMAIAVRSTCSAGCRAAARCSLVRSRPRSRICRRRSEYST
jgi:transcriptional regulator with XRE-family HTH domain